MKKCLFISNTASMVVQFNMNNLRILNELGFQTDVACNYSEGNTCSDDVVADFLKELDAMNIGHYQIDFKRSIGSISGIKKAYKQVINLIKDKKYDLVFCQSTIGGIVGRLIGKKTKSKVIYIAHGFLFYKGCSVPRWLFIYPIEWLLSHYTDILITTNMEDYRLSERRFRPKHNIYVPGVGVDLKKFCLDNVNINDLRKAWDIKPDDYLIVTAGELSARKNHLIVIEAIARINDPKIKFFICGLGELEEKYKEVISKWHLEDQVRLLGYRKNLIDIIAMSDLFILPSLSEGLPVALMIAIALKQNVICSDIRGNNDLILDSKYRFNPTSLIDIKNHILFARENRNQSRIDDNYNHLQHFSSEEVNKQMKDIFMNY